MTFGDGLRAALTLRRPPAASLEAAALYGPTEPAPAIVSPWSSSDHLNSVVWSDVFGTDANAPLNRAEAMSVPAVARARNILAPTLGRIPLVGRRGGVELELPQLAPIDPAQPRFITITWTVDDLIFHGVSWWLVLDYYAAAMDAGRTLPRNFRRIHPGGVVVDDGGRCRVYGREVDPGRLVRIDGPHEGILNYSGRSLRAAVSLERSAARFANNPVPAVELHQTDDYPMTPEERDELVRKWALARQGEHGGVAYTSRHIEAKVHGAPAEHLLTHGRNAAAIDVARMVGTTADSIDASLERASMTYANVETRLRVLVDFGLAAYAAAILARLSMDDVLPHGTEAVFRGLELDALDTDPTTPAPADSTRPAPADQPSEETP